MRKVQRFALTIWVLAMTGMSVSGATNSISSPSPTTVPPAICGLKKISFKGDLDKDGRSDLAVGVPGDESVHVLYGSSLGVSTRDLILRPGSNGLANITGGFGSAIALGDFDGNGYDDLAIGVPQFDGFGLEDVGAVVIVTSSSSGLRTSSSVTFTQSSSGEISERGDEFGSSLAARDFNHDGYADLLIGVPFEDYEICLDNVSGGCQGLSVVEDAGAVNVLYGSPSGLTTSGSHFFSQDLSTLDLEGTVDTGDNFGWVVAGGDFNGDGIDDAAIGVPGDLSDQVGAVNIIYGTCAGLTSSGNKRLESGTTGDIEDVPGSGDRFGSSLAAADFDGDGRSDLAVGAPFHDICGDCSSRTATSGTGLWVPPEYSAGAVTVFYGSAGGLGSTSSRSAQFWDQDSSGITDCAAEDDDYFGYSLVSADFDLNGKSDLAIGTPGEDIGDVVKAGMVNVLYGSSSGIRSTGQQRWYQGPIDGTAEAYDSFGLALAAGDFDGNSYQDLAIGVPYETPNGSASSACDASFQAGAVNIVYGRSGSTVGLDSLGNETWDRDDYGIDGSVSNHAYFGGAMASAAAGPSRFEVMSLPFACP
ncbi:MAG TPA: hypothetical protein VFW45_12745 [Candidatus Polarisedimenticolia bacterium]|nr:hypothetical protein [Candidatus Polarisedimenticolia bacterium]